MVFKQKSTDPVTMAANACPEWQSLPGEFFSTDIFYKADLDRIWRQGWLFVGFSCEIPEPGDYFTLKVGEDPLIVIRGEDGVV